MLEFCRILLDTLLDKKITVGIQVSNNGALDLDNKVETDLKVIG